MDGGGDGRGQLQGTNSAAGGAQDGGDWRALLRMGVVIMLKETLRKHMPVPELQSLSEIQKEAVRIEEMLYVAATSEPEYMWTAFGKKLSMENYTEVRQAPVNAQAIPEQNPVGPAHGLLPQGGNLGELSATPSMSQQVASLPMLGQSMPGFSQRTSTLQNMSGVPQNTMNEGFTQGIPQDISAAQRKLILQQQQIILMQQHFNQQQKPPMQQHIQQQSLLHPTFALSTQQPMILQKFSGLQPGQCIVPYFPTKQPIIVSRQQQQHSIGQQSIFQHGSVSGALQQESTLPIKLQSYPHWTSTMQPNNRNCSLEPPPRQKQEELIRMNEDMQCSQSLLLEKQLQLKAQKQSQKLPQAPMHVTHHLSENDVNELKDMYLVVYLLLSIGVLVAMLFMVYNHLWDLWRV